MSRNPHGESDNALQAVRARLRDAMRLLDQAVQQHVERHVLFQLLGPFAESFTQSRVMEFAPEKRALGPLLLEAFDSARRADARHRRRSCADLHRGAAQHWDGLLNRSSGRGVSRFRSHFHIVTNSILLRMALDRSSFEPTLLPYPWNGMYWATSPFPDAIGEVAAKAFEVQAAHVELHRVLHECHALFLTCSRLSLSEGPFSGSIPHALFKHVDFAVAGRKRTILLDGSKVLFGTDAVARERARCYQVFAPTDGWAGYAESPYRVAFRAAAADTRWSSLLAEPDIELWISRPLFSQPPRSKTEKERLTQLTKDMGCTEIDDPAEKYDERLKKAADDAGLDVEERQVNVDGTPLVVYRLSTQ